MKRNILNWNEFKNKKENLPIEKGKSTTPEYSKKKEGKSTNGVNTLENAKKHHITNKDQKGKKGKITTLDNIPSKKLIKDESTLKNVDKKLKDIIQSSNTGVSKKSTPVKLNKGKENLKYAKKKLKVK